MNKGEISLKQRNTPRERVSVSGKEEIRTLDTL